MDRFKLIKKFEVVNACVEKQALPMIIAIF